MRRQRVAIERAMSQSNGSAANSGNRNWTGEWMQSPVMSARLPADSIRNET